jgi:maltooligosyltrehalose trehalohydrolase
MMHEHPMPFGTRILAGGDILFRLWAPSARRVELSLGHANIEELIPMAGAGDGWFEVSTGRTIVGSRYRFRIDGGNCVPDPASRFNPDDVHGASEVVDPREFQWDDTDWRGLPWDDVVIYELHVGTFTPEGTYRAALARLDYLAELGVTALELMPVGDFPGTRNWGYDGTLPFAPDSSYGRPEDLKALIQGAHSRGLMVFLDVVYNHFGPEGNYLHQYASQFFSPEHDTPWGAGLNFDGLESAKVRDFFVHNALYWLEEYRFDGLRLDAVHAIKDDSQPDFLTELARRVRSKVGSHRHVHLILENDGNAAHYLRQYRDTPSEGYTAQWNDDLHHALHVLLTGEVDGYYVDYAQRPVRYLARCLAQGFAYQGERSSYRDDAPRGEPSGDLPASAFVSFLQTHDQTGNRAFGERITSLAEPAHVRAALALVLLAPFPPLLFMGEEFACDSPFLFFCAFGVPFAASVADGRRREFARSGQFHDPALRLRIPDPNAPETFLRSKLDWDELNDMKHREWLDFYRGLLRLRRKEIVPLLPRLVAGRTKAELAGSCGLWVTWPLQEGGAVHLLANLGPDALRDAPSPQGRILWAEGEGIGTALKAQQLAPWSVVWLRDGHTGRGAS